MIRSVVTVLLLFFLFQTQAQSKKKLPKPEILFSVNERPVTSEEFIYLYNKNHQGKEDFTQQKIDDYLTLFVNFKLKVEEARARGFDTTSTFIKEFGGYKEELRKPYLPEGKLVDSLVKLTYGRLQEEIKASHILIGLKPDATPADTSQAYSKISEIRNRALSGEDFGALASKYSEDPSAKTNQGNLGYFTALQMVFPFENAAYSGKPGDVVGPVRTRFGYHILKIEDRKPARGEVEVSHIMIRTGTGRDENQTRNVVFELHDQLKGGVSWDELCAQYSEDTNSKNSGGRLKPFGVGAMAAAPEFDAVAFSLKQPGEISDPFQTAYGWHIIRLEKKIPLPSLEELTPTLKTRVQRDERVQVSKQALMQKLKKEFQFIEYENQKARIFELADSSLTRGRWKVASWAGSEVIFSIKNRTVPTTDFVRYVNRQQNVSTLTPAKYIEQLYNSFVESVISDAHEEQLLRTNPDYEMLLREYYEGILLFDIMEKEVWNKASDDTTGLQKYFEENKDQYKVGERVVADLYASNSMDNINQLRDKLSADDSLGIQTMIQKRLVRLEKGTFQKTDRSFLSKIEWKTGIQTTENNGMYYLAHILEMKSPGLMTLDEARATVISDYQNYLEKSWLVSLKSKYTVKINDKAKQNVFKRLSR